MYNQINQHFNQFGSRVTFLKHKDAFNITDTSFTMKAMKRHIIESYLQKEVDTNNNIIVKVSANVLLNEGSSNQQQLFTSQANKPLYAVMNYQASNGNSRDIKTSVVYAHRFKRAGHSLSGSVGYNSVKTGDDETVRNMNQFFDATSFTGQMSRLNTIGSVSSEVKMGLL